MRRGGHLPIQWQRIAMLGGEDESTSEMLLRSYLSPEGSKNLRMSKLGLAQSVDGCKTLNATAITTNTGGDAVKVVGMYHYRSRSGGVVTRREVAVVDDGADEYEIWHSTDGGSTWAFLKDLGSSAVNLTPSFAQSENTLIMAFGGTIAPQSYDGTSVSTAGQTQPTTPTVAAGSTGVNLNGVYQWKVAIIDASGVVGPASVATSEITLENLDADLSSIPTGPAGSLGRRIFRNTGDGKEFFKVGDIDDNTTTTFNDNVSDKTLLDNPAEVLNHGDPPPAGARVVVFHRSRIVYIGTPTNPNRIYYSDIGKPDSVGPASFERVGEGESGDLLTGGFPEFEGELILPKEDSMWVLQGSSRSNFNLIRTQASVGVVSSKTMSPVPRGAVFSDSRGVSQILDRSAVVGITAVKDIRVFDGATDIIISSQEKTTLASMSYKNRAKAWSASFPDYGWILFGIPTSDATDPTMSYVGWDYLHGQWFPLSGFPTGASACIGESSTAGSILFVGEGLTATGGLIYQFFSGTDINGSSMVVTFRSRPMDGSKPHVLKMLRALVPLFRAETSSISVTINVYKGYAGLGATPFATFTRDVQLANANLDDPDPVYVKDTNGNYPVSKAFVIEFTVTGTNPIALHGWLQGMQFWPREL